MRQFLSVIIFLCILVIAISSAFVVKFWLVNDWSIALAVGAATGAILLFLTLMLTFEKRANRRRITDLTNISEQLLDDTENLNARLKALEEGETQSVPYNNLVEEIEILSGLLRKMADAYSGAEERIIKLEKHALAQAQQENDGFVRYSDDAKSDRQDTIETEGPNISVLKSAAQAKAKSPPEKEMLEAIKSALDTESFEMHLQPIIELPDRKVGFYEAFLHIRIDDNTILDYASWKNLALPEDILMRIDSFSLFRSVQILRRLTMRNKNIGIFCNLSLSSMSNPVFGSEFIEIMQANKSLEKNLIFQFSLADVMEFGALEFDNLGNAFDLGYRFSINEVENLDFDLKDASTRGFRYIKTSSSRLFNKLAPLSADIRPEDIASFNARNNITVICDDISSEEQILRLIDCDISLAQGEFIARPRPIRSDVFTSATEVTNKLAQA